MTRRLEYLIVTYEYSTWTEKVDNPLNPHAKFEQRWAHKYYIWRPGAGKSEEREAELGWLVLLNELAAEGWEFVDSQILGTTMISGTQGWPSVATPTRIRYTLKRELPS